MVLKAVIFDFDGTIYNSTKFVYLARKHFFKKFGIDLKKSDFKKYLATPTPNFIAEINKKYKIKTTVEEMRAFTRPEFVRLIKNKYVPNHGIKKLLDELNKNKIKVAIASANRRDVIIYDLKKLGLEKYFKTIVSTEDIKNPKPAPDTYILAAGKLKVSPCECIGVEDGPDGILGMNRAGLKSIAIITEFTTKKDFIKINPNIIVKSTKEITLKRLQSLFKYTNQNKCEILKWLSHDEKIII